jgi:hypothetical protein
MNTWMNNPQYLAQIGHFLGGIALILLVTIFTWKIEYTSITFITGVVAAAIKEFWYDANYELPKQTWQDNLMDFSFYLLGGVIGFGLSILAMQFHKLC